MKASAHSSPVRDMAYISLFAALIALSTWISIPSAVPFTMQVFAVFLSFALLGGKRGTLALLVYIALGAVGAPVFSGFRGGIAVLVGPTGGYIVGFVLSGLLYQLLSPRLKETPVSMFVLLFAGLLLCYCFGTLWFMFVYGRHTGPIGFGTALSMCVLPFVLPDILKIILALACARKFKRFVK